MLQFMALMLTLATFLESPNLKPVNVHVSSVSVIDAQEPFVMKRIELLEIGEKNTSSEEKTGFTVICASDSGRHEMRLANKIAATTDP